MSSQNEASESSEENLSEFLLYTTPSGDVRVEIFFHGEDVWLTQKRMANLFNTTKQNIAQHLKNIFEDDELDKKATVKKFFTVQTEGDREVEREKKFYNLDAIIAVGYRVNSRKATQFRQWATERLKEFVIKGFVIDDRRMKNGKYFGEDYFQELLERVRSIRASERRIYQKITDIFAECSIDYDSSSETTKNFFAMVQNKFHYAIKEQTAAEIIHDNADKDKPNMGLKTWENSPDGRILKSDVKVAKNYLEEDELKRLERTVSGFFDYIENIIENRNTFTMEEFAESVDKFLNFNEYKVLDDKGKISKQQANKKAIEEYEEFNKTQEIESDFDKAVKEHLKNQEDNEEPNEN